MPRALARLIPKTVADLSRQVADHITRISARPMVVLEVHFAYDRAEGVWYIAKSDIPGVCLRADDPRELITSVQQCAREAIDVRRDELTVRYAPTGSTIAVRPVFDSPLQLAGVRV